MRETAPGPLETRRYDAIYGNFQTELYAQIRSEAYGDDIGQNSWLTAQEHDEFLNWLALSTGKHLLDVACGAGGPTLRAAALTGCMVTGIDIHEGAIVAANSLATTRKLEHRASFQIVSAGEPLRFPDASFDAVICIDAINHIPERGRVISDWARLLKPAGKILFTDPIVVTGPLTDAEMKIRSSSGFYLFVPEGYNERVLLDCGFLLLRKEDVTKNMAEIAARRRVVRANHEKELRVVEGDSGYEEQQTFLAIASLTAIEKRLSRLVFLAEKRD